MLTNLPKETEYKTYENLEYESGINLKAHAPFILAGIGLGAIAAFLLDPISGKRRRARLGDKLLKFSHKSARFTQKKVKHIRNKTKGAVAKRSAKLAEEEARLHLDPIVD